MIRILLLVVFLLSACSTPPSPASSPAPAPLKTRTPTVVSTAAIQSPSPIPGSTTPPAVAAHASAASPPSDQGNLEGVYEDEVAGIAINYPDSWHYTDVDPANKQNSYAYAITFVNKIVGPTVKGFIPPDLVAFDLVIIKTEASTFEQAAALQKSSWLAQDPAEVVTSEAAFPLAGGLTGRRWQVSSGNDVATVYASFQNGRLILVSGRGNQPGLIERIAGTLRPIGTPLQK